MPGPPETVPEMRAWSFPPPSAPSGQTGGVRGRSGQTTTGRFSTEALLRPPPCLNYEPAHIPYIPDNAGFELPFYLGEDVM
ncbi:hypothetical protein CLOM_g15975 [Closterium sp. NIES-68]|nr:hypothetical protein CLOM_g15975 [Closterium sp. NIES-68]GJP85685.1 hypothetical protein CLOP_g15800 [Closterium sp. NIES-67]